MNKLLRFVFLALFAVGVARADDSAFVAMADAVADAASSAVAAATAPEDSCNKPPRFRNWRLRSNIDDIRKIANQFRDRAARGKARSLVSKLKVKRLVANMETCNYLAQNGAACGLDAFPAAWAEVRARIGAIVAEMCCGDDA